MKTILAVSMITFSINFSYANEVDVSLDAEGVVGMQETALTAATHCGQRFVREIAEETARNYEKEAFGIEQ